MKNICNFILKYKSGYFFTFIYLFCAGLTVLGTSVYGGAIMAGALDYFIEKLLMVHWVWDRVALRKSIQPCWFSWIVLSVWPAMVVFGLITQFAITGRGIHHQQRKFYLFRCNHLTNLLNCYYYYLSLIYSLFQKSIFFGNVYGFGNTLK